VRIISIFHYLRYVLELEFKNVQSMSVRSIASQFTKITQRFALNVLAMQKISEIWVGNRMIRSYVQPIDSKYHGSFLNSLFICRYGRWTVHTT
jgi:hypothetical protein